MVYRSHLVNKPVLDVRREQVATDLAMILYHDWPICFVDQTSVNEGGRVHNSLLD